MKQKYKTEFPLVKNFREKLRETHEIRVTFRYTFYLFPILIYFDMYIIVRMVIYYLLRFDAEISSILDAL